MFIHFGLFGSYICRGDLKGDGLHGIFIFRGKVLGDGWTGEIFEGCFV